MQIDIIMEIFKFAVIGPPPGVGIESAICLTEPICNVTFPFDIDVARLSWSANCLPITRVLLNVPVSDVRGASTSFTSTVPYNSTGFCFSAMRSFIYNSLHLSLTKSHPRIHP